MGCLIKVALSFALLCSASCLQKRGIVETNYGYQPYQQSPKLVQIPNYYTKEQSTPLVHDGSKQSPVIVSVPNYNQHHQQFQTVGHPEYTIQATAQVPYTAQQNVYHQGVLPYSQANQYSVHQPFQPVGQQSNLYIPFNQFQQISTNLNSNFRKPVPVPQPTNTAPQIHHQIGQKVGTVKSTPLFHHQVYHPLHTSVQNGNHAIQQNPIQKQKLAPPTPPRIYTNFHPIIPPKPAPVKQLQDKPVTEEQEEDKEEINEQEEEEENEKLEDEDREDHGDVQEEKDEDREYFGPGKFFDEDDHERYRHHHREADEEEDHDDSHRYSESRPSKHSSKYRYPKDSYYKEKHFSKPFKTDPDFKNFREFKDPKVEYKMYKYSKTSNKPERKEYIEGKGSENIPVIQHSQKSYKEQWIISSKTSSMSNEE